MNETAERLEGRDFWKKCNICKKEIGFKTVYFLCSVSTCRSKRTGMTFCSANCYDVHLGYVPHRSSYCEEATSPATPTK